MKFVAIIFLLLCCLTSSQKCYNHAEKQVDWFVILVTPGSVSQSYLYFDSSSKENFQHYEGEPDRVGHPLHNTFTKLSNSTYEIIAWNDQNPNGSTSSTKAHSKTVVGYDISAGTGIFVVHSMPMYPAIKQKWINETIQDSQSIYGQHVFCFNSANNTKDLLTKSSIITPYFYANTNNDNFTMSTSSLFQYSNLTIGKNRMRTIYKNGKINGSIFEDGLAVMFGSNFIAETWGRPLMSPWCGSSENRYKVGNSLSLQFKDQITWKQTQDHSKWALPLDDQSDYSCFGDMNRMQSQFKRGGAFYCIQSKPLKTAMKGLIKTTGECS